MKNRNILHSQQQAEIYRRHYEPSLNLLRTMRSILAMLLFGTSTVANSYTTTKKRNLR